MKKITLFVCTLTIGTLSFAQTAICPTSFKRDNGNGPCPSGRLTFNYATCPNPALTIDSIFANGVKQNVTISSQSCSNGKAIYCISGGNLAPAGVLRVYFSQNGIPGTGYNCYVPETGGGPTPITLSSFNAKRIGSAVVLNWKTEMEINAKQFVLQRKTETGFMDVAVISATNKATGSIYSFTDNNPSKTISQYRLKMVDVDGSYRNSDIRTVKGTASTADFIIYPNPSTGSAKVSVSDVSEATTVQLIDNAGRIIKTVSMLSANTIELNDLQKGMYMIRIVNTESGESTTKKLTVIN